MASNEVRSKPSTADYMNAARGQLAAEKYRDRREWAEKNRLNAMRDLADKRRELLGAGVMPSALPVMNSQMSPESMSAAMARMEMLGGKTPTAAYGADRNTSAATPAVVARPGEHHFDYLERIAQNRALVDLKRSEMGLPSSNDAASRAADAAKVQAGAMTGQPVQTQHGVVSSAPPSVHERVLKAHPEIGIAGSQANADFLKAYNASQAGGADMEKDPVRIASNVVGNIRSAGTIPKPGDPGFINPMSDMDIKAPSVAPTAQAGVPFAGFNVGEANWNPIATPSAAQAAGQAIGAPIKKAVDVTGVNNGSAWYGEYVEPFVMAGQYIADGARAVGNFGKGLFNPDGSSAKPPVPDPVDTSKPVGLAEFPWSKPANPSPSLALSTGVGSGSAAKGFDSVAPKPPVATGYSAGGGAGVKTSTPGTEPVGYDNFFGSKPMPSWLNGSGTKDEFADFRRNPMEDEFKKKLKGPAYANDGI
jgi:hypothetical protein